MTPLAVASAVEVLLVSCIYDLEALRRSILAKFTGQLVHISDLEALLRVVSLVTVVAFTFSERRVDDWRVCCNCTPVEKPFLQAAVQDPDVARSVVFQDPSASWRREDALFGGVVDYDLVILLYAQSDHMRLEDVKRR